MTVISGSLRICVSWENVSNHTNCIFSILTSFLCHKTGNREIWYCAIVQTSVRNHFMKSKSPMISEIYKISNLKFDLKPVYSNRGDFCVLSFYRVSNPSLYSIRKSLQEFNILILPSFLSQTTRKRKNLHTAFVQTFV